MIFLHLKSTTHLSPRQADRAQVSARLVSALGSPAPRRFGAAWGTGRESGAAAFLQAVRAGQRALSWWVMEMQMLQMSR